MFSKFQSDWITHSLLRAKDLGEAFWPIRPRLSPQRVVYSRYEVLRRYCVVFRTEHTKYFVVSMCAVHEVCRPTATSPGLAGVSGLGRPREEIGNDADVSGIRFYRARNPSHLGAIESAKQTFETYYCPSVPYRTFLFVLIQTQPPNHFTTSLSSEDSGF